MSPKVMDRDYKSDYSFQGAIHICLLPLDKDSVHAAQVKSMTRCDTVGHLWFLKDNTVLRGAAPLNKGTPTYLLRVAARTNFRYPLPLYLPMALPSSQAGATQPPATAPSAFSGQGLPAPSLPCLPCTTAPPHTSSLQDLLQVLNL